MKKLWLGSVALLALASGTAAIAADMQVKAPIKAPPPVYNWSGGYVGISLGGRWADTAWAASAIGSPPAPPVTTSPTAFDSSTFRVGGYIGYNLQVAPLWIVGVEGDLAWGRNDKTSAGIPGTLGNGIRPLAAQFDSSNVTLGWDGSLRGRLGFLAAPTWLLYATGGLAWQKADINASCLGNLPSWCVAVRNETFSTTRMGWTVGGGVEALIWNNWLLRAEYRYSDYGNIGHTFFANAPVDQVVMNEALKTHVGLVGLAIKFGGM